jgi:RNA polymerase sigma factor (sigma-70 family)
VNELQVKDYVMRKTRYLENFEQHIDAMRRTVYKVSKGNSAFNPMMHDDVEEILQHCLAKMILKRMYNNVKNPRALRSYLCTVAHFECLNFHRVKLTKERIVGRLPDTEANVDHVIKVPMVFLEQPIVECPFCFKNNLNEYGACNMCHTIVPSHFRTKRNTIRMTEESIAIEFDFNKQIDIATAIAQLTPKEQMIVKALGLGEETLDSLSDLKDIHRQNLWRIWASAKQKLQVLLAEYACDRGEQNVCRKSPKATLRAFQAIEK